MDPESRFLPIGSQLSTLQLFLRQPFLLPSLARCKTWCGARQNTKPPPITWKMRPTGLGTFHRKADRVIGCRKPRVRVRHIHLLRRFDWTPRSFDKFKSYPRYGTCL